MQQTPFDRKVLWVHWKGDAANEATVDEMAAAIRNQTPTVAGVLIKTSDGTQWQGDYDTKAAMAITGPESIQRWVTGLAAHGLETHLWHVGRGREVDAEARVVVQACSVPGVKSMLLDIEGGAAYFGGRTAADARALITRIRSGIAPAFHLGLNFDARGSHPASIYISEWLPYVQSLHPMVYHWEFGGGENGPEDYLDDCFGVLARYGLPVIPMLQTYPTPRAMPEEEIYKAGNYAFQKGAFGVTLFRYGGESSSVSIRGGVRRIDAFTQPGGVDEYRRFRVTAATLRVRSAPSTSAETVDRMSAGALMEVEAVSRTEAGGYVWWKAARGWVAQARVDMRLTFMVEVTPNVPPAGLVLLDAPVTPPTDDIPGDGREDAVDGPDIPEKRFRVTTSVLNIRSQPKLERQYIINESLKLGDEITVSADAWTEANGYLWWNHGPGWSAERSLTTSLRFMQDLTPDVARIEAAPAPEPVPIPEPEPETPEVPTKRFQVITDRLNIRSEPTLDSESLTGEQFSSGNVISAAADAWSEASGYLWWQTSRGWVAERSLDVDNTVFLQDLTPEVERIGVEPEPEPTPEPQPEPAPEPPQAPLKRLRVLANLLNIRSQPGLGTRALTGEQLRRGDVISVRANAWAERDSYVWWQFAQGWVAERRVDNRLVFMEDLTPEIPREEDEVIIPEPAYKPPVVNTGEYVLQVVALGVSVRSEPSLRAAKVGTLRQGETFTIAKDRPDLRAEADGYIWFRHEQGWSAAASTNGAVELIVDINALPLRGKLFKKLPVRIEDTQWIQYYGNTSFAYGMGRSYSYHKFSQGLHAGLDFGHSGGAPVFAGVEGIFLGRGLKYGPNRVDVKVGDYRIIYGHLGSPANFPLYQTVTPDAIMGIVEITMVHLHLEVRYKDKYIINPLLLMPEELTDQFIGKFPPRPGEFVQTSLWDRFLTPFEQPVLRLGGEVIGPTA